MIFAVHGVSDVVHPARNRAEFHGAIVVTEFAQYVSRCAADVTYVPQSVFGIPHFLEVVVRAVYQRADIFVRFDFFKRDFLHNFSVSCAFPFQKVRLLQVFDRLIVRIVGKVAVSVVHHAAELLDCVADFHKFKVVAVVERGIQERRCSLVAVFA